MASVPHTAFSPIFSICARPYRKPQTLFPLTKSRTSLRIRAGETDPLGDFGARDPYPAEIESNFGEKVLGNVSTEHKILIPTAKALSLMEQECVPVSQLQGPMPKDVAKQLLFKVVGWRIVEEGGSLKLQGMWKVRDRKCGEELINRIIKAAESKGHLPILHFEEPNQVSAQLWTSSIGGLSMNDFIVAATIDNVKVSDLQPRLRVWA